MLRPTNLLSSPLLPELDESADKLPPFAGGDDELLVRDIAGRINEHHRLMSEWSILAFVRAVRERFPDGGFRTDDIEHQDELCRMVGFNGPGKTRLRMAKLLMENLAVPA